MEPAGPAADARATQLVVLAHGVGEAALRSGPQLARVAGSRLHGQCLPLALGAGDRDAGRSVLAALPACELRDLGLRVDRKSLVLRPPWRSDDQVVEQIGERSTGPAAVTVLDLHGPLAAAVEHGPGGACDAALMALADLVERAQQALCWGEPPALWFVALGAPVVVRETIDVAGLLVDGWPSLRRGAIEVAPHAATIAARSQRELDLVAARLLDSPLATAAVETLGGGRILLLAPDGVAFGTRPLLARACHPGERPALAQVPCPLRTADRLDLRGLCARVAMAAVAAHAGRPAGQGSAGRPQPTRSADRARPADAALRDAGERAER